MRDSITGLEILPDLSTLSYVPESGDSFFHYCPEGAFQGICTSRSVWLTSVWEMNDSDELWWGRKMVGLVLANNATRFPPEFREFILSLLAAPDHQVLPLVTSFSGHGDLLSQWTRYADDGQGFAIKFDARIARRMPVHMKRVLYDRKLQAELILNSLELFYSCWKLDTDAARLALREVLMFFAIDLVALKHPTFFEEREVRMVHLVTRSGSWWKDEGGHDENDQPIDGVEVQKRRNVTPDIAYIALPFPDAGIVTGVVLGPKNPLSTVEVERKLVRLGLPGVSVRRSSSPYR